MGEASGWRSSIEVDEVTLQALEEMAATFAGLAGSEIVAALGRTLQVRYKSLDGEAKQFRNPVSEVDHNVEMLLRSRLAEHFPDHGIVGEEIDSGTQQDREFVWAIDPVDGTSNFINGFPLFAASVGVLFRRRPIVGAVWCATSHALRPGVYHARHGGPLRFEQEILRPRANVDIRRHLAGMPQGRSGRGLPWDSRKTGSAAIECAFTAAGLLRVARFERPNLWDVAGGVPLVLAAGGEAWVRGRSDWTRLEQFGSEDPESDLRLWRQNVVLGDAEAVSLACRGEASQTKASPI